jgi:tetratricopeptide (TPR) repeat protein
LIFPRKVAAFATAMLVSFSLGAADDPSLEDLAARAQQMIEAKSLDEAEKAIEQALAKNPRYSPALLQKARLVLIRGNESPEALNKAELLLQSARNNDFDYTPTYVVQAYVYQKLGRGEAGQAYFQANRRGGVDAAWLLPYHIAYLEQAAPDQVQKYRDMLVKSGTADPKMLFDTHNKMLHDALAGNERAKADAEYAELVRLEPNEPFLPGDYARDVMLWFNDFDAGERYARQALAMRDYPHARQTLSLALYGKWAVAKRAGRDTRQVRVLLDAAQANDPGARNVPVCALEYPPMKYLADSLMALGAMLRRDPTQQKC